MGSADTGAREPQPDSVARSAKIAETREVLRNALASTQVGNAGWNEARDALDTLCALAAGVGVPPDEDQVAQSAESADVRGVVEMLPTWPMVRCDVCHTVYRIDQREGLIVGRCPKCAAQRFSTTMPAGVGEARPAEPSDEKFLGSAATRRADAEQGA